MKTFYQFLENNINQTIIQNAFSKGINKSDPSILGFHGTSIQTIMTAINTGYLTVTPGTAHIHAGTNQTSIDSYGPELEDYGLHIVPNSLNKIVQAMTFRRKLEDSYDENETPYMIAMMWAKTVAERHAFFDKYDLDINNPEHHQIVSDLSWNQKEKNEAEKEHKLKKPKTKYLQGGVVLAISDDVINEFKINLGGDGDDINIIAKQLPVRYILGIEPENDAAYDLLDQLN
jgi:hypothetical protein